MRNQLAMIAIALLLGASVVSLAACEQDGPAEEAGEQVDETMDEAGDAIEDAVE